MELEPWPWGEVAYFAKYLEKKVMRSREVLQEERKEVQEGTKFIVPFPTKG